MRRLLPPKFPVPRAAQCWRSRHHSIQKHLTTLQGGKEAENPLHIAKGLISVKPGDGNVLCCCVGVELQKLPGSYALSIAWQHITKDFGRPLGMGPGSTV